MDSGYYIVSLLHDSLQNAPLFAGYIDPGTGSMLLTIIVGMVTALTFALRKLKVKLSFLLHGGAAHAEQNDRIPIVIFSDSKRYWNVFEPVCEELDRRGQRAEYWTASPDDPALSRDFTHVACRFIGEGNAAFAKLNVMKADVCLSTTPGLDVLQWKRSQDTGWYAHVFHALDDGTLYRMFGLDHYDAVLPTGTTVEGPIRKLEALRNQPAKEFHIVGATFLDALDKRLADAEAAEAAHAAENTENAEAAPHVPTILLAPSWGPSAILARYGASIIEALLATGYRIIVRPHPQSATSEAAMLTKLQRKFPDSAQLTWDSSNDNFETLRSADLMISDFSGVVFDFALVFNKPVLYADTSFDTIIYDAAWLDSQPWILASLPLLGHELDAADFPHMRERIDEMLQSDTLQAGRDQLRAEAWHNRGHAAEAIADYLQEYLQRHEQAQSEVEQ